MKKGILVAGVALVAIAAAVVLPQVLRPDAVVEEAPIPVVELQTPKPGSIELFRNLVGSVEPSEVVYIYPKAAGEVTEVYVLPGDEVVKGQPICKIDTKQVEPARLSLQSAEVAVNDADRNLERQRALFAAGDISSVAFEQAESQARSARIQYDNAKLNYDNQVEYSNITASISGKVESCDIEVHDNVSQQSLICVISGEGTKSVSFSVPEKILRQLKVGDSVTIQKNGMEYEGNITELSTMIDSSTGLFKIKASVESGDALPTGSTVKLYVISDRADDVMTLPVDAIYYAGGDAYVYTYDDGIVHSVPVEVGIYDSELIEILGGIDADTQVITSWSSELFEGSRVQTAEAARNAGQTAEETSQAGGEDAGGSETEAAKAE